MTGDIRRFAGTVKALVRARLPGSPDGGAAVLNRTMTFGLFR
ncbi:MAG TPA: hypothetical protein PK154_05540 [Methanoregulaceae archaeon]|nr:hypothetical protein [Methanoregulaceae archaeon]